MTADILIALRRLSRTAGFTATVVLLLAAGIGANVAVFTLLNAVLLRPLPFREPDRLVSLSESHVSSGQIQVGVNPGSLLDWQDRAHSFDSMSLFWTSRVLVTNRHEPALLNAASVSPGFFDLMGIQPVLGRSFPRTDRELVGHEREIVISYRLWQQWFGGQSSAIGQVLEVQGRVPLTIVGVMPQAFLYPGGAELWRPEVWQREYGRGETDRWRQAVGRLKPNVTLEMARRDLGRLDTELAKEFPDTNTGWASDVEPLRERIVGKVRNVLAMVMGAVFVVFVIACINVATLVLQRSMGRQREMATRLALGAGLARLVRENIVEHTILTLGSTALGGLFAVLMVKQMVALAPATLPRLDAITLDYRVLLCVLITVLVSVLVTGCLPLWRVARISPARLLQRGGSNHVTTVGWRFLIAAEVSLAVVLLAGALMMARTLHNLQRIDVGFDVSSVSASDVMVPISRITATQRSRPAWDRLVSFYDQLVSSVETLPGVDRAALIAAPALAGTNATWFARTGIVPPVADGSPEWRPVQHRSVTSGYFEVLRLPLVRGRAFTADDQAIEVLQPGAARRTGVAIVNRAAARYFWGSDDVVGKSVTIAGDSRVDGRVVTGVAGDARDLAPDVEPLPTIYVPFAQSPDLATTFILRAGANGPSPAEIRGRLRQADSLLMIGEIRPLAAAYAATLAPRRFVAVLLSVFAVFGVVLSAAGLYGLVSGLLIARTRECAIRIALGATPRRAHAAVLRQIALVVSLGFATGALGGLIGARFLRSQLFGTGPLDLVTWSSVLGIMGIAAIAAAWGPARRAIGRAPAPVLRLE